MISLIKKLWKTTMFSLLILMSLVVYNEVNAQDLLIKADSTRTGFLSPEGEENYLPYENIPGSLSIEDVGVDIKIGNNTKKYIIVNSRAIRSSGFVCYILELVSESDKSLAILNLCRHREDVVILFEDRSIYSLKVSDFSNPNAETRRSGLQ